MSFHNDTVLSYTLCQYWRLVPNHPLETERVQVQRFLFFLFLITVITIITIVLIIMIITDCESEFQARMCPQSITASTLIVKLWENRKGIPTQNSLIVCSYTQTRTHAHTTLYTHTPVGWSWHRRALRGMLSMEGQEGGLSDSTADMEATLKLIYFTKRLEKTSCKYQYT